MSAAATAAVDEATTMATTATAAAHCLQALTNVRSAVSQEQMLSSSLHDSASSKRLAGVISARSANASASESHTNSKRATGALRQIPSELKPTSSGTDDQHHAAPSASPSTEAAFLEQSRMLLMRLSKLNLTGNNGCVSPSLSPFMRNIQHDIVVVLGRRAELLSPHPPCTTREPAHDDHGESLNFVDICRSFFLTGNAARVQVTNCVVVRALQLMSAEGHCLLTCVDACFFVDTLGFWIVFVDVNTILSLPNFRSTRTYQCADDQPA